VSAKLNHRTSQFETRKYNTSLAKLREKEVKQTFVMNTSTHSSLEIPNDQTTPPSSRPSKKHMISFEQVFKTKKTSETTQYSNCFLVIDQIVNVTNAEGSFGT
jgi:hypothetical protein